LTGVSVNPGGGLSVHDVIETVTKTAAVQMKAVANNFIFMNQVTLKK